MTDSTSARLLDFLARWQAFSELQQRAFAFLAAEAMATGAEFEHSTDGATAVLTRMGQDATDLRAATFQVVQRLQSADRSRQRLEQLARVLDTLRQQHAELAAGMRDTLRLPEPPPSWDDWIDAMAANVALADWRHRLVDALNGREPQPAAAAPDDDSELF